ncbi:hypothetical protein DPMN_025428 [Dreissena polymorpha]|uniref:Uncharacterized protein n=1 Tax=Dreissena polymorpha TaxID=45954 RepID=A0A9D4LR32_DREPO|nr:hypothetical protein DPMN_025428 [Dreissena polymorpha]
MATALLTTDSCNAMKTVKPSCDDPNKVPVPRDFFGNVRDNRMSTNHRFSNRGFRGSRPDSKYKVERASEDRSVDTWMPRQAVGGDGVAGGGLVLACCGLLTCGGNCIEVA